MALLRIVLVSALAAVMGCAAASLVLYGTVDRSSFAPLIFALPGSLLLLATGYAALKERGAPTIGRYLALLAIGAVAGALMLGFISLGEGTAVLLGSLYGVVIAVAWIILHFVSRVVTRTR